MVTLAPTAVDDGFLDLFFSTLDTPTTRSFICKTMFESHCATKNVPMHDPAQATQGILAINGLNTHGQCLDQIQQLPLFTNEVYFDANTRACRMLHGVFASQNIVHCPHLSFKPITDITGRIRCQTTEAQRPSFFFSSGDMELFRNFKERVNVSAAGLDTVLAVLDHAWTQSF